MIKHFYKILWESVALVLKHIFRKFQNKFYFLLLSKSIKLFETRLWKFLNIFIKYLFLYQILWDYAAEIIKYLNQIKYCNSRAFESNFVNTVSEILNNFIQVSNYLVAGILFYLLFCSIYVELGCWNNPIQSNFETRLLSCSNGSIKFR